ncbi:MAG: hypothetical protein DCC58_17860 [Chloroflexi bacterium]|nr:MAG: hypothetical protein DCC58_17860 [Chloroflexota bacterium]
MGQTLEPAGSEGGTVVEGSLTDISSVMPVVTDDDASGDFQATIFEPLFAVDPFTLEPVGVLAAAWESNDDASVWTIYLRDGVTWHDGEPFTADDVRFTYDLHMHPDTGSSYTADLRAKIASIDVIDDRSIRFTLSGSTVDFPLEIGIYPIVAAHIWASVAPADIATDPGTTGADPSRVIGTGPLIFAEWVPGDHATAVRNPRYWGGAPHIDAFVYKVVPDQATGVAQLKAGDIHLLQGVAGPLAAQLQGSDDIEIVGAERLSFTFYATNMDPEKTPLFQDANVRKALLYAIDRAALVDDIRSGYGSVAIGTLPPFSWAADPDGIVERYEYNPARAVALLEAAGWVDRNGDGVVDKNGLELSFTAYTNAGNPEREAYLKAIQAYWQAIGVRMEIRLEEYGALLERISISHEYEVVLLGFGWSATPDQSAMWACNSYEGGYNMVKYCNPAVDALAAEALNEADATRRRALYTEMQNLLLDDLPLAILDFPQLPTAVSTRLHNVFPSDINLYWNINTWWVE